MHPATEFPWTQFDRIDLAAAADRVRGVVKRTPLAPLATEDRRIAVRGKMENTQTTGSFKARGAWNQVAQLGDAERRAGVVCASSGNHGKALAWAAERAGVPATIVMPRNAYANKVQACRDHGADVVLAADRIAADVECAARVAAGMTLVHPYDAERTIQGAGTVGLEIAEDWPEVEVVVVCVGGGGLISGTSLALRRAFGRDVRIFGAEPEGSPSLTRGIAAGESVHLDSITSRVQGLTPTYSGAINVEVCRATLDGTMLLPDELIFAGQKSLVSAGHVVEPAGAAAYAAVIGRRLPAELLEGRTSEDPLRVAVVVSGGNPDPAQLESLRAEIARERLLP